MQRAQLVNLTCLPLHTNQVLEHLKQINLDDARECYQGILTRIFDMIYPIDVNRSIFMAKRIIRECMCLILLCCRSCSDNKELSISHNSMIIPSRHNQDGCILVPIGRKSCEFTSTTQHCIDKAKANLNRLQNGLEQWRKNKVFADHLEKVKNEESLSKLNVKRLGTPTKAKLEAISSGTALEVYDQSKLLTTPLDNKEGLDPKQLEEYHPHKSVIDRVLQLVSRLETDRSEMEKLLEQERNRTRTLREKIDWHAYRRIQELPKAVQKEHEKCAYDVQELKWHCAYQGRIEARIREKVRVAESINKKINEEIKFIKENSPLIEDKLALEEEAMFVIDGKQTKTDTELKNATETLRGVEHDFYQLKKQADHEQKMLAEKILISSNDFKSSLETFLKEQEDYEKMSNKITELDRRIWENSTVAKDLDRELSKIESGEENYENQLSQTVKKIEYQTELHAKLRKQNETLEEERVAQENMLENMRKNYNQRIIVKTKKLQKLVNASKGALKDIANLKKRIENCEKQKISDAKAVKRAVIEKEKVEADLQIIREETDQTRTIHEKLLLRLDQERVKAAEIEENLNLSLEALKKQNKDESHARMILQARINADSADFEKRKQASEKKRAKMIKTDEDIKKVIATVTVQVNKIGQKYEERLKAIDGLTNLMEQVTCKHEESDETYTKEIATLEPTEQQLKSDKTHIIKQQNEMDDTSMKLDKKLRDMAASSIMMNKLLLSNQKAIDDLNEEIVELQIQLDTGQGLETTLRQSLQEVKDRSNSQCKTHTYQFKCRKRSLKSAQKSLSEELELNKQFAIDYIEKQNKHINEKNSFINTYEKSLLAQEKLKDKKNLCELHSRLHKALKCYYRLRGLQTKSGLTRFNDITRKSNKKLQGIQEGLETCIRNITLFLEASNNAQDLIKLDKIIPRHGMEIAM